MNYHFHPEAEVELNEAVDYYEDCQEGLGLAFAKEVNVKFKTSAPSLTPGAPFQEYPKVPDQSFPLWCDLSDQERRDNCRRRDAAEQEAWLLEKEEGKDHSPLIQSSPR